MFHKLKTNYSNYEFEYDMFVNANHSKTRKIYHYIIDSTKYYWTLMLCKYLGHKHTYENDIADAENGMSLPTKYCTRCHCCYY